MTEDETASSGLGNKASQQRARGNQGMRRGETAHIPIASSEGNVSLSGGEKGLRGSGAGDPPPWRRGPPEPPSP